MKFLEFQNISKSFPGVKALQQVTFGVEYGSVHGIIGENGAGKSTLIKVLSGFYKSDSGALFINGKEQKFSSPFDALNAGVEVIHQELQLIPNQTVAENIHSGTYAARAGLISWKRLFDETREFLKNTGISLDEKKKISELTIGQQQMVEIAKAIRKDAKIIAFDEPTSSLSKLESEVLFRIIRKLRDKGKAILYISHRMAEIFELCDACTVLKDGCYVATHQAGAEDMSRNTLIAEMTGRHLQNIYQYRPRKIGKVILRADNIEGKGLNRPCSLQARRGEIIGMFGLVGAGRSELVRLIYGCERFHAGKVVIDGKSFSRMNVHRAINNGVMFCTEDRKKEGIINGRSIWENLNISGRRHFSFLKFFLNRSQEFSNAQRQVNQLKIKTPNLSQDIVHLSGGNQQKTILGRWLSERGMMVLIVDEPTRGIDIGAKNEIYQILYDLAETGVSIIMISGELPEIMGVCDRIYIMREGGISHEMKRDEFNETTILEWAFPKENKEDSK